MKNVILLIAMFTAAAAAPAAENGAPNHGHFFVECERLLKGPYAQQGADYALRGLQEVGKAAIYFISPGMTDAGAALVGLHPEDSTHAAGGTAPSPFRFEIYGEELLLMKNDMVAARFPYRPADSQLTFWKEVKLEAAKFREWEARKRARKPSLKLEIRHVEEEKTPQVGIVLRETPDARMILKLTRPRALGGIESSIYNYELAVDIPCDKVANYLHEYKYNNNRFIYALTDGRDLMCRFGLVYAVLHDFQPL